MTGTKASYSIAEIIEHQIKKIDESWPFIDGNSKFLHKKLHETRIKFRENELRKTLLERPYNNASIIMKMPLTHGSGFGLIILYEYIKKYNSNNTVSFMLRIANKAIDPNMRSMARVLVKQHLEQETI